MATVTRTPDEVVEAISASCLPCELAAQIEDGDLEEPETPARWEGVLTYEGQMTGDGRIIENDALRWDTLPVPLRWVSEDVGAHAGATVVGRITEIERRDDGAIWAAGDFDLGSEKGREAARQVQEGLTPGVSVDLDDVSFEVRVASETMIDGDLEDIDEEGRVKRMAMNADDEVTITTAGRIRAATLIAIPAFEPARLAMVASIALTASGVEALTAAFNEDQLRVPKGNGDLSGRWLDMPTSLLKDIFNSLDYDEDGEDSVVQEALRDAHINSTEADAHRYSNSEKHNDFLDKAAQDLDRAAEEVASSDPATMERIDEARDAIRAFQDVDWGDGQEDVNDDGEVDAPESDTEADAPGGDIQIGDTVRLPLGHTGVVTGVEDNGDLEVRSADTMLTETFPPDRLEKVGADAGADAPEGDAAPEGESALDKFKRILNDSGKSGQEGQKDVLRQLTRDELQELKDSPDLPRHLAIYVQEVLDEKMSADSEEFNWVEDTGTGHLPPYIKRIEKHLRKKGMTESHAIATAVNVVKKMCATGDVNFPGKQDVNVGSRAEACAAVAEWEAKKAQAKANATLTAGSFPLQPPATWFSDPDFDSATPLKVDKDGRVYGHLAVWGICHTGYPNTCVTPPTSNAGYAYFRTGSVYLDDGSEVPTGVITMDTLHAGKNLSGPSTLAHYENTGRAVADVAVGEDAYGIWVAGSLRPDITDEQARTLRGSPLSGDWRRIGNSLELVAALAVNVPGFPIPRPAGIAAGGAMQTLVAAGMLAPESESSAEDETLSESDMAYLKRLADKERQVVSDEAAMLALEVDVTDFAHKIGI